MRFPLLPSAIFCFVVHYFFTSLSICILVAFPPPNSGIRYDLATQHNSKVGITDATASDPGGELAATAPRKGDGVECSAAKRFAEPAPTKDETLRLDISHKERIMQNYSSPRQTRSKGLLHMTKGACSAVHFQDKYTGFRRVLDVHLL